MSLTATLTSAWSVALPFADAPPKLTDAGNTQLLLAALAGIAAVVLLISWAKFHPFLALIIGAAVMGGVAGVQPADIVTSFTKGLGSTTGSVGLLIALGAMIGKLLQDSGGSETIVDRLIGGVSPRRLPWMMALIAFILGIPLFFEVGVVLLVPVVILVARKLDLSLMKVGIPALAGLSILHGFVPPHPGPLLAIDIVKADLSTVLLYGLVISVPTLIVSGPLLARFVDQWVPVHASGAPGGSDAGPTQTQTQTHSHSHSHSQPQPQPRPSASEASLVWQARQMSPWATSWDMSTVPALSTTSTRPASEISKVLSWLPYSSAFWAMRPTLGTEPIVVGSKAPLTRQSSMTVW